MRLTLDTNCIIDVEEDRPDAPYIRTLVSLHGQNDVNIAVSAIGASERQRDGGYAGTFEDFQQKLRAAGFGSAELLAPLGYWDLCFYDHCVYADDNDTLERGIHEVLFPTIEFNWADYAGARGLSSDAKDRNWRNAKCDVLGLWCHIHYGSGIFVSNDRNFHAATKVDRLRELGAGMIAYPKDAVDLARGQ